MRVCMVVSVPMPPGEGIGYYTWNLSRFLIERGHQVQIITRGQRGKPRHEIQEGISIWRPPFYPTYPFHVHLHGIFVQKLVQRLEDQIDIFHIHTPLAPPMQTHRPCLVTVHTTVVGQTDLVQIQSLRSLLVRAQIPVSTHIQKRLLDGADTVTAVAYSVGDELVGYGVAPGQVEVLGNGVDTSLFYPVAPDRRTPRSEVYIFAAGRLDPRKGFEDLIGAMSIVSRRFPEARLFIAGTGPSEAKLGRQIAELRLERMVHLVGHVDHAQMVRLYREAALFAHAAHYEGLPTVLLEAMACGTPAVATAVSGALDVVEDGVNGLLVPPHAPKAMAGAICRLLNDSTLRARLGAAARRTVEDRFSWQAVGAAYLRCYRELLEGGSP